MTTERISHHEISVKLRDLLANSGIKTGSVKARTVEQAFLHGMIFADERYMTPYIAILLVSGRSILDDHP
jgi:hypothetical protein